MSLGERNKMHGVLTIHTMNNLRHLHVDLDPNAFKGKEFESIIDFQFMKDGKQIGGGIKNLDRNAPAGYMLCPATFTDAKTNRQNEAIGWSVMKIDGLAIRCLTPNIVKEMVDNEDWYKEVLKEVENTRLLDAL